MTKEKDHVKTISDFRKEYEEMAPEERKHLKKLIAIILVLVLVPVICGLFIFLAQPPFLMD